MPSGKKKEARGVFSSRDGLFSCSALEWAAKGRWWSQRPWSVQEMTGCGSVPRPAWHGGVGSTWLDPMVSEAFPNLTDSVIL